MNKKQVSADEEKFIAIGVETSEFERKNCLEYK